MCRIMWVMWKKCITLMGSILILSMAVFYVSRLAPGDPLVSYYGERAEKMNPKERDQAMEKLGLNESIGRQYLKWIECARKGEFGISFKYKQDVKKVIRGRIGNTLWLGGCGFLCIFTGALFLGMFCAWREDSITDRILCRLGTVLGCVPEFWFSLILIFLFSVKLRILPGSGAFTIGSTGGLTDRIRHLILPLTVVVIEHLWYYAYLIRNRMLEEMKEDYVQLSMSKGLSNRKILFGHCLKNVLPAYFSLMAIAVPHILGGTYVVETVFSYPGLGALSYESARFHDYNLLMLLCLISGTLVICCSMLSQTINERIDPRIGEKSIKS